MANSIPRSVGLQSTSHRQRQTNPVQEGSTPPLMSNTFLPWKQFGPQFEIVSANRAFFHFLPWTASANAWFLQREPAVHLATARSQANLLHVRFRSKAGPGMACCDVRFTRQRTSSAANVTTAA